MQSLSESGSVRKLTLVGIIKLIVMTKERYVRGLRGGGGALSWQNHERVHTGKLIPKNMNKTLTFHAPILEIKSHLLVRIFC